MSAVKLLNSDETLRSEHNFYGRLCGEWQDDVLSIKSPDFLPHCFPHYA